MKVKVTIGYQVYYIKSTLLSASFNPQRGGQGGGNRGREEQHNSIGWSGWTISHKGGRVVVGDPAAQGSVAIDSDLNLLVDYNATAGASLTPI